MEKIVTDEEYQEAIEEVIFYEDAEPNTPEEDEYYRLIDLIRAYEDMYYNL